MKKNNYEEIINSIIYVPNIVILIREDGSQILDMANDSHVLSMKRIIEENYSDLFQVIVDNPDLEDFMTLVKEMTKRKAALICKHVDVYGVFLPEKVTKKQLNEIKKDLLYMKYRDLIYSGIYSDDIKDMEALHYGKLMSKRIFLYEIKNKKN